MNPRAILAYAGFGLAMVLAIALMLFGVWKHGHKTGKLEAEVACRAAIDQAKAEADKDKDAGYAIAANLEAQLRKLEARNAKAEAKLRTALDVPFQCPASGRLGDVVIPAAVVGSLFDHSGDPSPPGPASSQPDATVR